MTVMDQAIFKFGGTSLGSAERIRAVARIVAAESPPTVVVVSAVGGLTTLLERAVAACVGGQREELSEVGDEVRTLMQSVASAFDAGTADAAMGRIELALQTMEEWGAPQPPSNRSLRDEVLAAGEDISSALLVAALQAEGREATVVDPRTVIRTDSRFGEARPDEVLIQDEVTQKILPLLEAGQIVVIGGFVGADETGRTTTLGRGGSDYTATLLGAALDVSAVHIWTDVDGILTGDPRQVDRPRSLDVIGFEEAVELAWFGATVLHAGAAKHAVSHGVPVRIRSTFAPDRPGTLVLGERWAGPDIAAVACKTSVALMQVRSRPSAMEYGFLAGVFGILARHRTPVDLVATSHTSTAFTIDAGAELGALAEELEELAEVEFTEGLATVTVVGRGLLREPGFAARVFETVAYTPVRLISQATDASLSFLVDEADAERVVRRLHRILVEGRSADGGTTAAAS